MGRKRFTAAAAALLAVGPAKSISALPLASATANIISAVTSSPPSTYLSPVPSDPADNKDASTVAENVQFIPDETFYEYPFMIQIGGKVVGGPPDVNFTMQCGIALSSDGKKALLDLSLIDLAVHSKTSGGWNSRYQIIDDSVVVRVADPQSLTEPVTASGPKLRTLVELVKPDGQIVAKNCASDASDGKLDACVTTEPFMTIEGAKKALQAAVASCQNLMEGLGDNVQPSLIDPVETARAKYVRRQLLWSLDAK